MNNFHDFSNFVNCSLGIYSANEKQFDEDAITVQFMTLESDINRYTKLDFSNKLPRRLNLDDICINVRESLTDYIKKYGENSFVKNGNEKVDGLKNKWFDLKCKFTTKIWVNIFQFSDIKALGVMSSVSKVFEIVTKDNQIWKPKCFKENPNISNPKNLLWKVIYKDEFSLQKFLGPNLRILRFGTQETYYVDVNLSHPEITAKHLKMLIIKQKDLQCSAVDMKLIFAGKVIQDEILLEPLKLYSQNLNGFVFMFNKES